MKKFYKIAGLLSLAYLSCGFVGTASTGGGPAAMVVPPSSTQEIEVQHSDFVRMENRMRSLGKASLPTPQGILDVQELSREFYTIEANPRRITPIRPLNRSLRRLP